MQVADIVALFYVIFGVRLSESAKKVSELTKTDPSGCFFKDY
jgi:hypothetical protein